VLQDGDARGGLVGESGTMNMFFLIRKEGEGGELELITPPLDGLILPGVTRDTVLTLARSFGNMKVSERPLRFDEVSSLRNTGTSPLKFFPDSSVLLKDFLGIFLETDKSFVPCLACRSRVLQTVVAWWKCLVQGRHVWFNQ
jgi:branched-chain amino acid aminotransferase